MTLQLTARLGLVAGSLLLAGGCTSLGSSDPIDYRGAPVRATPLDVPPDLTQLARDSRYQSVGGVISAAGTAAAPSPATAGAPTVALNAVEGMRVERAGDLRWLVVPQAPEQLFPQVRAFWEGLGFTITAENAAAGVLETNWAENRGKLPADVVRNLIGRLARNLYDTGERDQYRTRIERTEGGAEVYITHRGIEERVVQLTGSRDDDTTQWRLRDSDPQLEAEMLVRLMVSLGARQPQATLRETVAAAPENPAAAPARARKTLEGTALELDESFDRAWRRVGLALDRGSFTVEDRDRNQGLYYVRYIDPNSIGKEEPGFWARLFGDDKNPLATLRARVAVRANGPGSVVAIAGDQGGADTSENAKRIIDLLHQQLR